MLHFTFLALLLTLGVGVTTDALHTFTLNTTHAQVSHPFIATCFLASPIPQTGPLTVAFNRGSQSLVSYTFPNGTSSGAPKVTINPKHDYAIDDDLQIRPLPVNGTVYKVEITPLTPVSGTFFCSTQKDRQGIKNKSNSVSLQVAPLVPTIVPGAYSRFTLSTTLAQVGRPFTVTCQLTVSSLISPHELYYSTIFRNGKIIYEITFPQGTATLSPKVRVNPHHLTELVVRPLAYNFTSAQIEITPSAVGYTWYGCGIPNSLHMINVKVGVVESLPDGTL